MISLRNKLSLKFRSFGAAILALIVFIPLTALTLEQAFVSSLAQSMKSQLNIQSLMLISEFEFDEGEASMPETLTNDSFNLPGSGLSAFIIGEQRLLWRSLSSLDWQHIPPLPSPSIGQELFLEDTINQQQYFIYSFTAEFENSDIFTEVTLHVVQNKNMFNLEVIAFRNTLWNWLMLISLLLLALLIFSLGAALRPINHLISQIDAIEQGQQRQLTVVYPPELEKLKARLNHLLNAEYQQRERYKNSLGDLAHSLKTPLSVLAGITTLPVTAKEPIEQIDNIIQRQLKRAVAGTGSGWSQGIPISPTTEKLINAMGKVYADKKLSISQNIPKEALFYGDQTDLMEILGNLLDNACKAASEKVAISVTQQPQYLSLNVDDDGPGIDPVNRKTLLHRGVRLDSYQSGQGIGMAVVSDLVAAYQGKLLIDDSQLGGAHIEVQLPTKQ